MAKINKLSTENDTVINKNMLVSIVSLAAKEIDGVVDLYDTKKLFFQKWFDKNVGSGVRIKYTSIGVSIDVYLTLRTDVEISDVIYRVQQNIKNSIMSLLPIKIKAINVHVKDAVKL